MSATIERPGMGAYPSPLEVLELSQVEDLRAAGEGGQQAAVFRSANGEQPLLVCFYEGQYRDRDVLRQAHAEQRQLSSLLRTEVAFEFLEPASAHDLADQVENQGHNRA